MYRHLKPNNTDSHFRLIHQQSHISNKAIKFIKYSTCLRFIMLNNNVNVDYQIYLTYFVSSSETQYYGFSLSCSETIITLTQGYRLQHMSKVDRTYPMWITKGSVAIIPAIPNAQRQNYADAIQQHLQKAKCNKEGHSTHKSIIEF